MSTTGQRMTKVRLLKLNVKMMTEESIENQD